MTAPDARNVFGWVMVGGALMVAFVVGVVLAARWPYPALVVASHSAVALVVWWATDRGLREQLAGLTERHDAWNRQAKSTDLAEVGPIVPPAGTDRPIEVEPFMADSGYLPPAPPPVTYGANGGCVNDDLPVEGYALTVDTREWVALCAHCCAAAMEGADRG